MKYRKLRELEVSEIGVGCMGFSHGYGVAPEKSYSVDAIRKAYEFGCTFFDTAEVYGREQFYFGHNEELVGEAIAPFRSKVVLATKITITDADLAAETDLYKIARAHLEASLRRLKTDRVELYYLHRMHESIPVEDVAGVMGRLIEEGLVGAWGLSQVSADTIARAHAVTPVTAVQNLYSMLERDCEQDVFPYCLENHIGVVPFSPIASGLLSGKITVDTKFEETDDVRKFVPQLTRENIAANQPIIDLITSYARNLNATPAQISLAWMLHKYPNVVPIPGSKNQGRILENLGATNVAMTDDEFEALDAALDEYEVAGHRGHIESLQTSFGRNWSKEGK